MLYDLRFKNLSHAVMAGRRGFNARTLAGLSAISSRSGWAVPPVYSNGLSVFADKTQYGADGVHPNTTGNATMKTAVAALI